MIARVLRIGLRGLCVSLAAISVEGAPAGRADDLDAFMEKVLARREVNRLAREQYVLDERESLEILGPGRFPIRRMVRDYTWYARDGMHVRSPVRFDGVQVDEEDRNAYETRWIRRERERAARKREQEQQKSGATAQADAAAAPSDQASVVAQFAEPRFVSEAYFMDFKFEPGNYYLAGQETLEGKPVLKIEYYPTRLFTDDEGREKDRETRSKDRDRERAVEQDINRKMNKTALVTLWVDPAEHQIVKYTFENIWMDFLPGRWMVKVDAIRASMTMGQPFAGVWLPRHLEVGGELTLASGTYAFTYARAFSGYREAEVTTKLKIPREPR